MRRSVPPVATATCGVRRIIAPRWEAADPGGAGAAESAPRGHGDTASRTAIAPAIVAGSLAQGDGQQYGCRAGKRRGIARTDAEHQRGQRGMERHTALL